LVFDTIYAEGQRRYLESLSSYARQFLGGISKPDVDKIESLSPTIAVNQKTISANPRSTVGTITEIYDYLRVLFTNIGEAYCPNCNLPLTSQNVLQISDKIFELVKTKPITLLAPTVIGQKGEHKGILEEIYRSGWPRVRIDDVFFNTSEAMQKDLDKNKKHTIQVVIDEFDFTDFLKVMDSFEGKNISKTEKEAAKNRKNKLKNLLSDEKDRILQSARKALEMGGGRLIAFDKKTQKEYLFSELSACTKCDFSMPKIEPRFFSFNSPWGACPKCQGLGRILKINPAKAINPRLSLNEGAILPIGSWGKYMQKLLDFALYEERIHELGFSFDTPFGELPQKAQDIIMYGNDAFEGIIARMERLYHQTSSDYVREEIGKYMTDLVCPECNGARLRKEALSVKINNYNINDIVSVPVKEAHVLLQDSYQKLNETKQKIAQSILKEIYARFEFLKDVGVDYISLGRQAGTLSVGENQRIRLACQLGSGLSGIVYILDEPTVGLHQRDTDRLIKSLRKLVDLGNTVLVVEHDENVIRASDWVIEIGPESGVKGGKVVFEGTPKQLEKADSLTGKYFSGRLKTETGFGKIDKETSILELKGAKEFNINNLDLKVPLQKFVCVAGVSGAGKSTLVLDILAKALQSEIEKKLVVPGEYKELIGKENLNRVIVIDQSPIGRTPRSNPATYTGIFTFIRDLFAQSQEAKMFGFKASHFSFNTKYGRCPACWGEGVKKVEMYFLPDIYVPCEVCKGKRFTPEILKVLYNGKSIADVLDMSVDDAKNFFNDIPHVFRKLNTLSQIGLGYIKLGQNSTDLSGGESQRIKLSEELSKRDTGKTIYILDEPTTGLHFHDVKKLAMILRQLVDKGNSVLVIEHNLDIVKEADWVIEMGPEGGKEGGKIVFEGTVEKLKKQKTATAKYL
jgi:excinuclease ABC subunit A